MESSQIEDFKAKYYHINNICRSEHVKITNAKMLIMAYSVISD